MEPFLIDKEYLKRLDDEYRLKPLINIRTGEHGVITMILHAAPYSMDDAAGDLFIVTLFSGVEGTPEEEEPKDEYVFCGNEGYERFIKDWTIA